MDRYRNRRRQPASYIRSDELHQADWKQTRFADVQRSGDIPAWVRTQPAWYVRQLNLSESERNKRILGLCRTSFANHGKLCHRERISQYLCPSLWNRRSASGRTDTETGGCFELQCSLCLPQTSKLRPARYGMVHPQHSFRRRCKSLRTGSLEKGTGITDSTGSVYEHSILPYLRRRIFRRILQLQMGRSAGCGCFLAI